MSIISPRPFGPIPSPRQQAWHTLEYYGFLHFTVNTFTDREWGQGDESPLIFNPTDFSAEQIVSTAASGGMSGLILTAKHHDGFCLWPSDYTNHSVKFSPWRGGKGDVVGEIASACQRYGLRFGVYLSPWDRNHPGYATSNYLIYYRSQLRELMTRYGPLFEIWFDGANGGDGYYGGKYERRSIDSGTYYEWEETFAMIRDLQPQACIFNPPGADIRWVGNELGIAGDPCWHTFDSREGNEFSLEALNQGFRDGSEWFPAECDVSIRPGWFYHSKEDWLVRSPRNLFNLFLQSVGRGANLLLNIPPTRAGRIHQHDHLVLLAFKQLLNSIFSVNLAQQAGIKALNTRGNLPQYSASNLIDGHTDTYWATDDEVTNAEVILDFAHPTTFNMIDLREPLVLGQRVEGFTLDVLAHGVWQPVYSGQMIGNRRLALIPDQTTTRVRLRITAAAACPAISHFGLYQANLEKHLAVLDGFYEKMFPRIS